MKNRLALVAVVLSAWVFVANAATVARTLQIYFIDVEGGQSTLVVTSAGESLLIDAGYGGTRGGTRDAYRILKAAHEAGIDHLDYLLVTHLHPDHVGGIPELAPYLPIGTFIDYGPPLGFDRMTTGAFKVYEPLLNGAHHLQPMPGDHLPLKDIETTVISSGGKVLSQPLEGGGEVNDACSTVEDQPEDGTENYRSVGVMLQFGAFRFLDLGDLSGNTLASVVCPRNLIGQASVYLVAHHGDYDTNIPAFLQAVRPRVAVMNNGITKGGSPDAFRTLHAEPWLEDLWQLHASRNPGADNSADALVANVDDGVTGYWIKLTAHDDGSFEIINTRTGFAKAYGRKSGQDTH